MGESIDRVTRSLGVPATGVVTVLFGRWAELVGPGIAAHSRPVSLRGTTLVVAVDDGAWATQLRYLESQLTDRIATAVGAGVVDGISVRVDR